MQPFCAGSYLKIKIKFIKQEMAEEGYLLPTPDDSRSPVWFQYWPFSIEDSFSLNWSNDENNDTQTKNDLVKQTGYEKCQLNITCGLNKNIKIKYRIFIDC